MKTTTLIAAGLVAFAVAGIASAQAGRPSSWEAMPRFYFGGGLGWANLDLNTTDFPPGGSVQIPTAPGVPVTDSRDQNSLGWKLFGGWRALEWLNIEGGYTNLGRATVKYSSTAGFADFTLKSQAVTASFVPQWEIVRGLSFFGRLGAAYSWTNTDGSGVITGIQVSGNGNSNAWTFLWGGGLAYDFNPRVGVRVEYENYGTVGEQNGSGRASATLVSGSGIVRF
jgi:OOP family OmpA-OmpF porin